MALIEQRILNQVAVLPNNNSIQVQWLTQIVRDGDVISSVPHRKAYGPGQQAEFEAEIEGAASYVGLIDWTGGSTPVVPTVPQVITKRQAKLALLGAGLLDDVEAAIGSADRAIQIEWTDATEFRRTSPTITAMAAVLGMTDQQLDDLFTAAAQL